MPDLTIIILTKNEEQNLKKCIDSFHGVAKRIVVVDSFSTDNTVALAKELGADVYEHKFENHAAQFNWALDNINLSTEWVAKVDADEDFTPELAQEIDEKLDNLPKNVNGVILRRRVYFMGRWLKHGGKYPELLLRVFRVGHGMSEMKMMDEHLIVTDGDVVTFDHDFSDNNQKSLEWWVGKHNWYSNKEVLDQQMKAENSGSVEDTATSAQAKVKRFIKNHGYYSLPKFFRAHLYYFYRYYIRLGFLDGKEGKIYTFLQAYWYRYLVDAKLYECEKLGIKMEEQGELKIEPVRKSGGNNSL
ncbi:MAG: glycosyltransferase family 2 protein [Oscillospiraceae bacterium]|nr:glycosyltransferase family 2 protein [Oscillospiraceae bacterium]